MTIILNSEQEKFIQEKLKSGKYKTADEVIFEVFRLLEEQEQVYQDWLQDTRSKVAVALEQLNKGQGIEGDIVIAQLKEKNRTIVQSR